MGSATYILLPWTEIKLSEIYEQPTGFPLTWKTWRTPEIFMLDLEFLVW